MKIYKRIYVTSVECSSFEVSESNEKRYELGELDIEDLWDIYEQKPNPRYKYPILEYEKDIDSSTEYSLSEI